MCSKYPDLTSFNSKDNYIRLRHAYNNPEENPNISNQTSKSENEFEYQRIKESYKKTRSIKHLLLEFYIDNVDLEPYNFKNETYTMSFDRYTRFNFDSNRNSREKILTFIIPDGLAGIELTVKKIKIL